MPRRAGRLRALFGACLAATLLCAGCAVAAPETESITTEDIAAASAPGILKAVRGQTLLLMYKYLYDVPYEDYRDAVRAYALTRVHELTYVERDPVAFGPWEARREYGTEEASDDGSLTEWALEYYIAHDWSSYGEQILQMIPGDEVTINGITMRVEGLFDYPDDGYLDEIWELVGYDKVVLQTCEPENDYYRIIYGPRV
ncbi:MAG: hypothetical protein Q4C09_09355 [Atopobiaceae bacterium]|nr:hypothetical protein [Atopobiaceae bacterium]